MFHTCFLFKIHVHSSVFSGNTETENFNVFDSFKEEPSYFCLQLKHTSKTVESNKAAFCIILVLLNIEDRK